MKILFLSLGDFEDLKSGSVHIDILKKLSEDNDVYLVCKRERRYKKPTEETFEHGIHVLRVKTGNIKNTNLIEKGLSTVLVEYQFLHVIKKYLHAVSFDMILYTTPPITLVKTICFLKKRDKATTYLMLKDIFPQNAVDIGMMRKSGVKGLLYRYFRRKEKKLYALSDRIGCMSQANVDYVLKHNPEIDPSKVEICPNAIEVQDMSVTREVRAELREKYEIPQDKKVFVYGGNLGRPQGIPFLMDCLQKERENPDTFFLVVGDGTEYKKLETWFAEHRPTNAKLLKHLPKEDYDRLVAACDVGMIFLDHRFTIPNFPSRLLSYMQAKLPVLACTDPNTDIGKVITEGGFGWWCESNDTDAFHQQVQAALSADLPQLGEAGFAYLNTNCTVEKAANTVLDGLYVK